MKLASSKLGLSAAIFLTFLICGCSSIAQARRLSWLDAADPKKDCEAAIARGDLRFYAVNGFACGMVLGVETGGTDDALVQRHGYRTIVGTTDTSTSRLNQRASEYTRAYNRILLRYFHAKSRRI